MNCTQSCNCNTTNVINSEQACNPSNGKCICKSEWQGDTCNVDVNECDNVIRCDENTECSNLIGSYICDCVRGFERKSGSCVKGLLYI